MGLTQSDFIKRMESEYKQGKAYRYYKCDFVREIFFNHISEDSPYCILKCKVVPSQRVNNKPYDVWAVEKKDKIQEVKFLVRGEALEIFDFRHIHSLV